MNKLYIFVLFALTSLSYFYFTNSSIQVSSNKETYQSIQDKIENIADIKDIFPQKRTPASTNTDSTFEGSNEKLETKPLTSNDLENDFSKIIQLARDFDINIDENTIEEFKNKQRIDDFDNLAQNPQDKNLPDLIRNYDHRSEASRVKFDLKHIFINDHDFIELNSKKLNGVLTKIDDLIIPKGFELSISVDNNCIRKKKYNASNNLFSFLIEQKNKLDDDLEIQAFTYMLESESSIKEIKTRIENDECLVLLSDEQLVSPSAIINDPWFSWVKDKYEVDGVLDSWKIFYGKYLYGSNQPWNIATNVVIAVVDDGIYSSHPDLSNHILLSKAKSVVGGNPLRPITGHGTRVAGVIGAQMNNYIGLAGIMGRHVRIIPVQITIRTDGRATISSMANGIFYSAQNGAEVINISYSGTQSPSVFNAISYAVSRGIVVTYSAGNDGKNLGSNYWPYLEGAISVGALTIFRYSNNVRGVTLSHSSNRGSSVKVAAVGNPVTTTTVTRYLNRDILDYGSTSGTSFSAPSVGAMAGLTIGLLKTNKIPYTPALIEKLIAQSSSIPSYLRGLVLYGKVDASVLALNTVVAIKNYPSAQCIVKGHKNCTITTGICPSGKFIKDIRFTQDRHGTNLVQSTCCEIDLSCPYHSMSYGSFRQGYSRYHPLSASCPVLDLMTGSRLIQDRDGNNIPEVRCHEIAISGNRCSIIGYTNCSSRCSYGGLEAKRFIRSWSRNDETLNMIKNCCEPVISCNK